MNRVLKALLACFLVCVSLTGCAGGSAQAKDDNKVKVITTIRPIGSWTQEIAAGADDTEVEVLMGNGSDLHNYQVTAEDIKKISECDLFIYVGGESDEWVNDVLKTAAHEGMRTINLLEALGEGAREEEEKEGMQEDHDHEHEAEYDEHVWLSLRNAEVLCGVIADNLAEINPAHAQTYRENLARYRDELVRLDQEFSEAAKAGKTDTLLFADRFPFLYFVHDYNLEYYAAFSGCSAETEASFETVVFLADKLNELNLDSICIIESSDGTVAETVRSTAKRSECSIVTFDSMQSGMKDEDSAYTAAMRRNLAALKEALGVKE